MPKRLSTIKSKIEELQAEAAKLERANSRGVQAVLRTMKKHGVSLADVQRALKGKIRGLASRQIPPIKYRDPKTGDVWTGRGRMANWLVAHERVGRKKEQFLVKS